MLSRDAAFLLDMAEADVTTLTAAFWTYIKLHNLIDDEKRTIKADARLKKLFGGQDAIPLFHLPEYINRYLIPGQSLTIAHTVTYEDLFPFSDKQQLIMSNVVSTRNTQQQHMLRTT